VSAPRTRVAFVGTDTDVGKTHIAAALLRHARALGHPGLPFKPAQSGPDDDTSDAARLCAAAALPGLHPHEIAPLQWAAPLAPGLAEAPDPFTRGQATRNLLRHRPPCAGEPLAPLATATAQLATLEARHGATTWTLVEGAGGWWVPMPGGTWQPEWIAALANRVVLVARAGLGTINHTLLTLDAIHHAGLPLAGIILNLHGTRPGDPSIATNPAVLERCGAAPVLAIAPALTEPRADSPAQTATAAQRDSAWLTPAALSRLLGAPALVAAHLPMQNPANTARSVSSPTTPPA
jgi:dethiobiotin synthetase